MYGLTSWVCIIEPKEKKILFRKYLMLHKKVHFGIRIILRIKINIMKLKIQFVMLPKYCSAVLLVDQGALIN